MLAQSQIAQPADSSPVPHHCTGHHELQKESAETERRWLSRKLFFLTGLGCPMLTVESVSWKISGLGLLQPAREVLKE